MQAFRESQHDQHQARAREAEHSRDEQAQTRHIKSRLEKWRGKCVLCAIDGRPFKHSAWCCEHVQGRGAFAVAQMAQRSMRLEGRSSCTMCFAPRSMCLVHTPLEQTGLVHSGEDGRRQGLSVQ